MSAAGKPFGTTSIPKPWRIPFSRRELRLTGEPVIHLYGDAAVAEFDWEFTATRRADNGERHTSGRESQIYVRRPGRGWRLVHVHYSGPTATA